MPESEFELVHSQVTVPCTKIVIDPVQVEARLRQL
jgi:hypothetical protein